MQATSEVEQSKPDAPSVDRGRQIMSAVTILVMCAASIVNPAVALVAAPAAAIVGAGSAAKGRRLLIALLALGLVVVCMFLGAVPMGATVVSK